MYDILLVDTANLFFRLLDKEQGSIATTQKMINFIENEAKSVLEKDGKIYLLFDPICYSTKSESVKNTRTTILPDYKSNRKKSPFYLKSIEAFKKYYFYRGENIIEVYSDTYEADDFVEPLMDSFENKKVGLITTDHDWMRAYNHPKNKVNFLNGPLNKPYTAEDFEKEFLFKPTEASIVLYKAFFGDTSDQITGCIKVKKAAFISNIKLKILDFLKEVGESGVSLAAVKKDLPKIKTMKNKESMTKKESLYFELFVADERAPVYDTLMKNIKVIESALKDKNVSKYCHTHEDRPKYNEMVRQSIFGISILSSFGF